MKKGYVKMLIMEFFLMVILLLNSIKINFLTGYYMILFLVGLIVIFKKVFGLEKDKHSNVEEITKLMLIYLMIVLIVYYVLGLITGYAYNENYYTLKGLLVFIMPTIITSVLVEFLRYQMLQKSEGNRTVLMVTILIFVLMDVSNSIYYGDFKTNYNILLFIGLYMLPSIAQNICNSYISNKVGYKPVMVYMVVFKTMKYLLLIIPNYSEFMKSLFNLLVPAIMLIIMLKKFNDRLDVELLGKENSKKGIIINAGLLSVILVVTYFVSGYFKYTAVAIASGSMSPTFTKGSVVVVKKIKNKEEIKIGDIAAYEYAGRIIVHRVIRIAEIKGEQFYYTKGDANQEEDNYKVEADKIIGVVDLALPLIGYPTVWLNEL